MKLYNTNSLDIFHKIVNSYPKKNIIIVSDPPFNVGYHYDKYKDDMNDNDYYNMLYFFFHDFPSVVIHYPESLYKLAFKINKLPEKK